MARSEKISPPPPPAPNPTILSLPAEINAATRPLHTKLNRLILARLALALPPYSTNPRLYAFGLRHFAHVYWTFESLWHDVAAFAIQDPDPDPDPHNVPPSPIPSSTLAPTHDPRIFAFLSRLLPPGLPRSQRLRNDLAALRHLLPADVAAEPSGSPAGKHLRDYCAHIRRSVVARPHVLVAYAWVMYMAIFSGGRWIRAQLVGAGEGFWRDTDGAAGKESESGTESETWKPLDQAGLSFFHFPGDEDGEDIKAEFKRRLAGAETLLTTQERRDVVEEAVEIFRWSLLLVEELDGLLGTPVEADKGPVSLDGTAAHRVVMKRPRTWLSRSGFAGLAVLLSCVSWLAVYHGSISIQGKGGWT